MNRKNLLVALLVASLAGNTAFFVTAAVRAHGRPLGSSGKLELTTEQKTRFRAANETFLAGRVEAHSKLAELRAGLAAEFLKETPDRDRLLKVAMEMAEVQTARRPKLIEHLILLHGMLSPSQRATMADELRSHTSTCCAACPGSSLFVSQQGGTD